MSTLAQHVCAECGESFVPTMSSNANRFCSAPCYRANRSRGVAQHREQRLAAARKRSEQQQREREATSGKRDSDRRAELQRRAIARLDKTSRRIGLSTTPKLRTESPPSAWELERQSSPIYAAAEVGAFIERLRQETSVTIDQLSARLERLYDRFTVEGSGARTLFRLRSGEGETVKLGTVDALTLAAGVPMPLAGLTALAETMGAARVMVTTKAELDEEEISDAELEARTELLHRFSIGFLAGIQDIDLTAGSDQRKSELVGT